MVELTRAEVIRRRLAAQLLSVRGLASAGDVVRSFGAVQAQDYAGAKWALGQRVRSATDASVEREMAEGRFIRTHVLRPTWHFVAPEDVRWMLALTGPRVSRVIGRYNVEFDLSERTLSRGVDAMARALEGGKHLTREELAAALERARLGPAKGMRLVRQVMTAELSAVICSGARRGKQFTYALLDERVPAAPPLDRDESLARLARAYFASHGPATQQDFAWWSGLTISDARQAVGLVGHELAHATFEGRDVWFADAPLRRAKPVAHLLPNYDEFFIGHKDRTAIGGRTKGVGLITGGDGSVVNVITVNGELVGGWKRGAAPGDVNLRITAKVTAAERALIAAQVRRFAAFHGR
ncbi:MAG TPA: winged helix DNA-binding domain-containing protein [Gemmatimonadaceae bacterium]|nr:winged helix DNA-binding domain-containing protein [Gemmatimonadaceae bacterium]